MSGEKEKNKKPVNCQELISANDPSARSPTET